jgi:hypothetical protein
VACRYMVSLETGGVFRRSGVHACQISELCGDAYVEAICPSSHHCCQGPRRRLLPAAAVPGQWGRASGADGAATGQRISAARGAELAHISESMARASQVCEDCGAQHLRDFPCERIDSNARDHYSGTAALLTVTASLARQRGSSARRLSAKPEPQTDACVVTGRACDSCKGRLLQYTLDFGQAPPTEPWASELRKCLAA